ncbi:MAG TPA: NAD(P)-dependent oxidoreductase [Chthoniobacteraceae bacterium]|jgi:D-lactate dehydrogenase|nr:NAD(P)-dependent oxidoreductase [Chthoniobacteraceae bacterium]
MPIAFVETGPIENEFFGDEFGEITICESVEYCPEDVVALCISVASKIDAPFLAAHPNLRLIATRSTTCDHINLIACARRHVAVCNVGAGYGDHTVPEHVFALMLALGRRLRPAMEAMSGRIFSYESLRGAELHGRTLGVVGTGRIGRQVLRLGKAFGMDAIGCDTNRDAAAAEEIGFRYVKFQRMLELADFISINVPLTRSTYHLFDRDAFAKCRRGLILVNTARGPVIDSEALIEALDSGVVAGAGLDVLEDERVMRKRADHILTDQIVAHLREEFPAVEPLPLNVDRVSEVRSILHNSALLGHPNVIVTPHIAFNSHEAVDRINRTTADNIHAFLSGSPQNLVGPPKRSAIPRIPARM